MDHQEKVKRSINPYQLYSLKSNLPQQHKKQILISALDGRINQKVLLHSQDTHRQKTSSSRSALSIKLDHLRASQSIFLQQQHDLSALRVNGTSEQLWTLLPFHTKRNRQLNCVPRRLQERQPVQFIELFHYSKLLQAHQHNPTSDED